MPGHFCTADSFSRLELGLQHIILGWHAPLPIQARGDADGAEHPPLQDEPRGEDEPAHEERVAQVVKVAELHGGR